MRHLSTDLLKAGLRVHEKTPSGRAKSYRARDGSIWTQYQVQKAKNHGIAPATAAELKRAGNFESAVKITKGTRGIGGLIHTYQHAQREKGRKVPSRSEILRDKNFWKQVQGLRSKDTRPGRKLAKALEFLGWREPGARYRVKESPKRRNKR